MRDAAVVLWPSYLTAARLVQGSNLTIARNLSNWLWALLTQVSLCNQIDITFLTLCFLTNINLLIIDGHHSQGVWNFPHKFHLHIMFNDYCLFIWSLKAKWTFKWTEMFSCSVLCHCACEHLLWLDNFLFSDFAVRSG